MGHHIYGFIASVDPLLAAAATLPGARVARLARDYGFLPLSNELEPGDSPAADLPHLVHLTADLAAWAVAQSRSFPIAYIETDYFGGPGTQRAVLWRDAAVAFGPVEHKSAYDVDQGPVADWAINATVRQMGVQRGDAFDEFDALGLGRRRSNDAWIAEAETGR